MGKKKNKRTMLIAALLAICMLPALALLKTSVFGKEKNAIITDNTARYDIVADLDGGKFELGTKPEFTKMDNGKWLHKYKPTMLPTKLPKPVKDGYIFKGWTIEGETTPKPEYSIPSWNKKNINLTANWKAADSILLDGPSFNSALRYSDNYKNINHIKFVKGYPDPNGIDLSEKQDKSIMGSFKDGIFTIACEGKILANPDSSEMFRANMYTSEITFDNFDTTNVTNMENMFYVHSTRDSYASLRKINGLNKFNTPNVTNMTGMFSGCSQVESLDVSSFDTSKVTSMYRMFEGCETVKTLDVSNFNTSNVEDMGSMFAVRWSGSKLENRNKPANLTEIIGLERFDTSNVWNMQGMFSGCTNTINLNVSTFDTSKVVFMQGMFNGCWSLASIDVSNFNTANVTSMSYMFKECSKLKTIDVSNFNTLNVTDMSGMFSTGKEFDIYMMDPNLHKDSALKSIIGFENLDTSKVINMSDMFVGDMNLNQVNLKNLNMLNVKDTSYMFGGCAKLSGEMTIDNFAVTNYTNMFYGCASDPNAEFWVKWKTPEDKELGRKMVNTKREGIDHVYLWEPSSTLVDGGTFNNELYAIKDKIQHIKFVTGHPNPDGIDLSEKHDKSITGVLNGDTLTISCAGTMYANPYSSYMFNYLTYLIDVDFNNFDTSRITETLEMFSGCSRLESVKGIGNWDVSNVTNMDAMFANCLKLKTLDLNRWKTGKLTDINYMFQRCYELEKLDLKGFDVSVLKSCNSVFMYCTKLKYVDIAGWDTHNITHMRDTFEYCSVLQEINGLEGIDTTNCYFYDHTFLGCEKLCGEITIKNEADQIIIGSGEQFVVSRVFENASTDQNSRFVVKYINEKSRGNAAQLVGRKSSNSNVFLYNEPCTLIDGPTFNSTIVNKEYSSIRSIIFEQDVPHNMSKYPYKDLSVAKDKSIVAYVDGDTLKIASDGKIMANEDCSEMFRRYGLKEFDLSTISFNNFDVSNTISMWGMFYECPASKITGLERWDTSKVLDFEAIFLGTTNLQSINLRDWDLSNAQYGIPSFGRSGVKEVNVTGWNFGNQTDISNIFKDTYFLTRIIGLNTWDVSNITHMRSLFEGCGMKSIDLSSWDTRSLKDIGNMFYFCSGLESIVGLENLNTDNINHYESAFEACPRLTATLTIKKVATFGHLDRPHVTSALNNCSTEPNALFTIQYVDASTKDVAKWFIALSNTDDDKTTHVELKYIGEGPEPINTKEETKPNILNTFKSAFNPNKSATPKLSTQIKTVNITLNNGPSAMYQVQKIQHKAGKIGDLPKPDLNPKYAGQFGGYYYDQNCTIPVKPNDIVTQDIELYAKW